MMNRSRSFTFLIWGTLDAIYLAWYGIHSLKASRPPYVDDLLSTYALLQHQGGINLITGLTSWLLQLSLILSCALFLLNQRYAKLIGYAQIPLRLCFLIPSVSLVLLIAQLIPSHVLIVLIIVSETLKGWSLGRYT